MSNTRVKLYVESNGHCWYCGESIFMDDYAGTMRFSIDHIIPRSKGGKDTYNNYLPCCRRCNSRKGAKSLGEYRLWFTSKTHSIPLFTQEQRDYLKRNGFKFPLVEPHEFWGEKAQPEDGNLFDMLMRVVDTLDEYGENCQEWWNRDADNNTKLYAEYLTAQYVTGDEL